MISHTVDQIKSFARRTCSIGLQCDKIKSNQNRGQPFTQLSTSRPQATMAQNPPRLQITAGNASVSNKWQPHRTAAAHMTAPEHKEPEDSKHSEDLALNYESQNAFYGESHEPPRDFGMNDDIWYTQQRGDEDQGYYDDEPVTNISQPTLSPNLA